jgi:hypothetical protein
MGIDAHLIHSCDIQRPVKVEDGYSGDRLLWPPEVPTHLEGVRGRLVIKAQRVADTALAERPIITSYRWLTSPGIDVRQGDRIVNITDETGAIDAGVYDILEVMPRRAKAQRHISLLLERVGGA